MPERHACAVCGRILDHTDDGWLHANVLDSTLIDHIAVPVPADEIEVEEKCDFCYADSPAFIVPAKSFVYMGAGSHENWAACDECARLLSRNEWNALNRRMRASWESRHGEMPEAVYQSVRGLYRALRKNITGPPQPK